MILWGDFLVRFKGAEKAKPQLLMKMLLLSLLPQNLCGAFSLFLALWHAAKAAAAPLRLAVLNARTAAEAAAFNL